ncbi:hypothetical protein BASA61_006782 [Batrachochytrium salamandrivorans]|nr:hypothetical protein BASA61_006782 [Batrachochytrium salamandrivorans]
MPFLAVIVSGSTIPSTDSYNVQRLEKRGNDDPDIKEFTDEDLMRKLMAEYEAQRKVQSNSFAKYSVIKKELDRLGEQLAQVKAKVQSNIDKTKKEKPMELPDSLKKSRRIQRIYGDGDDEDDESEESSNILKISHEFQNLLTQEGEDNPRRLLSSLEDAYQLQYELANDKAEEMEQLTQELLRLQAEITSRSEFNERLLETQAQAAVQPSSISKVKAMGVGFISNLLKMPHGHSRGTETEPEQANDDQ